MEINTKYHGEIKIAEEKIIRMEQGIPGFVEEKQFAILPFAEESPFQIFQSLNTPNLAFVITNPFLFYGDYEFNIGGSVQGSLEIESESDVLTFVILTVLEPFEKTTANLKAPIVINSKNGYGKQIVLNEDKYQTKHLLALTPVSSVKGEK